MKIKNREIGPKFPPLVIAEIGINHGGDLEVAKKMVSLAALSGAECVKHQTHFVEDEMTDEAKLIFPPNADVSIWEVMEKCALSAADEISLKKHTEDLGLIYLSTPFSRKAANFLEEIDIPAFKIGSGEADNIPLIRHIARFGKPIILSTGMQTIESIRKSVQILRDAGVDFLTLGQYLQPGEKYLSVTRYLPPAEFEFLGRAAKTMGFSQVASGPFVRSSYHARDMAEYNSA